MDRFEKNVMQLALKKITCMSRSMSSTLVGNIYCAVVMDLIPTAISFNISFLIVKT